MDKVTMDRTMYKDIKRYNKQQMEEFLTNIYSQGFDTGMRKITESLSTKLVTAIKNTKGIGQQRFNLLMKNITDEFNKDYFQIDSSKEEKQIC